MSQPPWVRVALVLLAALASAGAAVSLSLVGRAAVADVRAPAPTGVDDVVLAAAAWAGCLVAAWLALGTLVSVVGLASRPAGRPPRVLPVGLHRLVALALGVVVVASVAPAAVSAGVAPPPASVVADPGWGAPGPSPLPTVDPGWTPTAPPAVPRTTPPADVVLVPPPRATPADAVDTVVVRRGDTLWDIAARHLPVGTSDAEIAAEWPRWYTANAGVVGDDPDLLRPGQRLSVPSGRA